MQVRQWNTKMSFSGTVCEDLVEESSDAAQGKAGGSQSWSYLPGVLVTTSVGKEGDKPAPMGFSDLH